MARWEKLTLEQFKEIEYHWDICTNDGCGLLYLKDINGLEKILNHCNCCHNIPDFFPSQKDEMLERLIKRDAQIKAKRY